MQGKLGAGCEINFVVTEAPAMVGNLLELFPTFSKGSLYCYRCLRT